MYEEIFKIFFIIMLQLNKEAEKRAIGTDN